MLKRLRELHTFGAKFQILILSLPEVIVFTIKGLHTDTSMTLIHIFTSLTYIREV